MGKKINNQNFYHLKILMQIFLLSHLLGNVNKLLHNLHQFFRKHRPLDYDDIFPHYGGEYRQEVIDRMYNTLKDIMDKEDHYNVLAVSHGGACYSFLSCITDPNIVRFTKISLF